MHFTIEKAKLIANIQNLMTAVPAKSLTPMLMNFLIEADSEKQQIVFTATDLELTIVARIQTNVIEEGKAAVSAQNVIDIVNSVEDKPITFMTEDGYLKIRCGKAVFSLLCADHTQFPGLGPVDFSKAHQLPAPVFAKMVSIASIAISEEKSRPIFTGVLWRINEEQQMMAATDGKKIAEVRKSHHIETEKAIQVVVPPKGLYFLQKVIGKDSPAIKVIFDSNRIFFSFMNFIVVSQTIAGRYPEYEKVLMVTNPNIVIINKELLRQAVRRVALLATDEFFRIKLAISETKIVITSISHDMGDATEEITDFDYTGPNFEIAFNYKFILAILSVIETDKVKIAFAEPENGFINKQILIFNHPDLDDYQAVTLIMPLLLK